MGQDIHFCTPSCHLTLLYVSEFSSLNEYISAESEKLLLQKKNGGMGMEAVLEM